MTRRDVVRNLALWAAGSPLAHPQSAAESKLDDMINVFDFDPVFKSKAEKAAYDYVSGGSWDEWTLKRNREAFGKITFLPEVLVPVDKLDLSTELFGLKLPMPVFVAPTGTHALLHPEGEVATARGAGAAGALMVVSTSSSMPLEKIAAAAGGPLWFQLYAGPDKETTRERVETAVALGCKAICWTVDAPYDAPRERDMRNRLERVPARRASRRSSGSRPAPYGLPSRFQAELDWNFLPELAAYAKVPVLVKGILNPRDAVKAADGGAAGVVVSNHGGRYLDGAPSTMEALPGIVEAVGGRTAVLIDGGFRRGTDILKALAIGARAVLVGRPPLWGLGSYGDAGVQRVLEILRKELAWAMALAGRPTIASIGRNLVQIEK
ncbi:MAG: alpha-hydroxy acid oxidase [Bryobacteraceae bacterium]